MILTLVLPHRRELTGVDHEHRAALQVPRNRQVVALRERVNLRARSVDDDPDGLRTGRHVIREIRAEARVVRGGGWRSIQKQRSRYERRGNVSRDRDAALRTGEGEEGHG